MQQVTDRPATERRPLTAINQGTRLTGRTDRTPLLLQQHMQGESAALHVLLFNTFQNKLAEIYGVFAALCATSHFEKHVTSSLELWKQFSNSDYVFLHQRIAPVQEYNIQNDDRQLHAPA